jgi:hypothetical protein
MTLTSRFIRRFVAYLPKRFVKMHYGFWVALGNGKTKNFGETSSEGIGEVEKTFYPNVVVKQGIYNG